ncbi:MAG: 23S rRNA (guanosine(2251)-2'-O)-methyltransferase RlmB, partial [Muribaculaceae bacterium]|nr:23S rRNA (guanosine(2251)-2'-O)-methyltransferase RlmB [Muribaculaceae bacterium]
RSTPIKSSAASDVYKIHIPVCRERSVQDAVRLLKDNGYKIVGASEKSHLDYTEIDYNLPVGIVMGSEDTGISNEVLRICDELAAIPIRGHIGSLNVSVAAGVMMYEVVKQRGI